MTAINCALNPLLPSIRDGQNLHMFMILKSKSNHLNKGDLKSKSNHLNKGDLKSKSNHLNKGDLKSKSFQKWWFDNQNHIENQIILKSF